MPSNAYQFSGRRPQQSGQSRENYSYIRYYGLEPPIRTEREEEFCFDENDEIPETQESWPNAEYQTI